MINSFFQQLHEEIEKIAQSRELIFPRDIDSREEKKYGEDALNNNGERFRAFYDKIRLAFELVYPSQTDTQINLDSGVKGYEI